MVKINAGFTQTEKQIKILIVKHSLGNKYGGPAEDLEEFLISKYPGATITVLSHPLTHWSALESTIKIFKGGTQVFAKTSPRKIHGQARHLFDIFYAPKRADYDLVFAFNSLALFLGMLACKNKDAKFVSWGVDYVPQNHRSGPLNSLLNHLQRWLANRIHVRIENTKDALLERQKISPLPSQALPVVLPIGVWRRDFASRSELKLKTPSKLLYLGSINDRTGIPLLAKALHELSEMKVEFTCDIIGDGPLLEWFKTQVSKNNLHERVIVHGYLPDYPDTRRLLLQASIGLAPFSAEEGSFTFFTDPQKIRRYLSSGLAVVSSNVPPIARDSTSDSGLISISSNGDATEWAKTIAGLLEDSKNLISLQEAALVFSESFENSQLFENLMTKILKV